MQIVRMYTGADGVCRMEDVSSQELRLPATELVLRKTNLNVNSKWHPAGRRQVQFLLKGRLRVEMEDGTTREFSPGDVIIEDDLQGKGHRAFLIGTQPAATSVVYL
ncbi:MAG: cupin domain-containing protein [SAR202 cluster bacterium]|nr:cupin domain-containing protein [SAR202 cluster bacterium]